MSGIDLLEEMAAKFRKISDRTIRGFGILKMEMESKKEKSNMVKNSIMWANNWFFVGLTEQLELSEFEKEHLEGYINERIKTL